MAKYTITIRQNKTKDIVVEKYTRDSKKVSDTFFHTEYEKALSILEKITQLDIEKESDPNEEDTQDARRRAKMKRGDDLDVRNNIIIFTGDRGSGKTSAMVSFGKYLAEQQQDKGKYKLLDIVDPSYFKKNESILLNIVTIMFRMAKNRNDDLLKDSAQQQNRSLFNDLLRKFDKVFSAVKKMDEVIPQENSLEYLNELAGSTDLDRSIYDLVNSFLAFFSERHEYLVIRIDDLDMNVSYAAAMLEQIRKFLIHKNIILLIATNIDQLQYEMKEYYSKYYDKILASSQHSTSLNVDVEDMATKYLLKLFPPLQRIHIGDAAGRLIDTELKIYLDGNLDKDKPDIAGPLQRVVLNMIWSKTRLIFIPDEYQLHPIIPANLRALNQFIQVLLGMENILVDEKGDPKKNKGRIKPRYFINRAEYDKARSNYFIFKDYIMNIWIPTNVSYEEKKVFDNIPKDIKRINKHLIQSINVIGQKYKKLLLLKEVETNYTQPSTGDRDNNRDIYTFVSRNDPRFEFANKISDIFNYPSNNTAGDILLLVDKYKTYFEAANQTKFIEAVKIYYSMLLYETMCFTEKPGRAARTEQTQVQLRSITRIQALIGGTMLFPHYFTIIKSAKYDQLKSREKLYRSGSKNKKEQEESAENHLYYNLYKNEPTRNELLVFFILYYGRKRPARTNDKHIYDTRKKDVESEKNDKYRFDLLSMLVNTLNPFHTIARYKVGDEPRGSNYAEIETWQTHNDLKGGDKGDQIQNIILPIYSVDLMLSYLREPVDAEDLEIEQNSNASSENTIDDTKGFEKEVRKKRIIEAYYDKLCAKMCKALDDISLNDNRKSHPKESNEPTHKEIARFYERIYQYGKSVFIDGLSE
jgi:hypothetical protein